MNKGQWEKAEQYRATDCETAFQSGGPKVYAYDSDGGRKSRPVHTTATQAIANNDAGEVIYARRKQRNGRYEWMKWVVEELAAPATSPTTANGNDWLNAIAKAGERERQEHDTLQVKLGEPAIFVPDEDDPRFGIGYWKGEGGVFAYRKYVNGYGALSRMEYPQVIIDLLVAVSGKVGEFAEAGIATPIFGTPAFTMAVFKKEDVPAGTKLYTKKGV